MPPEFLAAYVIERSRFLGGYGCFADVREGGILPVYMDTPAKTELFKTFAKGAKAKLEEINKAIGGIGWFSRKDLLGKRPGFPILCFKNSRDRRNLRIALLPTSSHSPTPTNTDNFLEDSALFISSFPFRIPDPDSDKVFNATMSLKGITIDEEKREVTFKGKSYHPGLPSSVEIGRGIGYKNIYVFPRGTYGLLQPSRNFDPVKEGGVLKNFSSS